MQNSIRLFDRFPVIFPTAFEESFTSGSLFNEFDKVFNSQKLKQMSIYPTDIYNLGDGEKIIETVIEIAIAGIRKEKCKIEIDNNVLIIGINTEPYEMSENEKSETNPVLYSQEFIQQQISTRKATMRWSLGNKIDKENIKVSCKDGILSVHLPHLDLSKNETKQVLSIE